jgi:AcrR family transcriptional regulator
MSAVRLRDRRAERYAATRREILDAAWELVRAEGLAALAMRDLGARVGMRAQSLYSYFPSKFAIYDAMFGDANRELWQRLSDIPAADEPVAGLRAQTAVFLEFCVEDPVRYQLLFQRTIPGFEPSPDSFAPAIEILDFARRALRACGIQDATALDSWTAVTIGIAAQQNSNEPGGNRWVRRVDDITDMFLAYYKPRRRQEKS